MMEGKPPIEVSNYQLEYDDEELVKCVKQNPDGSSYFIDTFREDGLLQQREWFRNGEVYRVSTTEYLNPYHKRKYFGWEIEFGEKREWEYTFEYVFAEGQLRSYKRFDKGELAEEVNYQYDKNGLLVKMEGRVLEQFEYEYYD